MSKIRLSPSKTKTYFDCGLKYWYNYKGHNNGECGIPSLGNDGSKRGGAVHAVLECLSNPKRRKKVEAMIQTKNPWNDPATKRLAYILAKKEGVHDEENFELIRTFILAAIQEDFYCDGADSVEIEKHFVIEGENYILNGFIDKSAIFGDRVKIIDYKTSKKKFSKEELSFNLQNYFYTFAAKHLWPGKKIEFDFLFLKFAPKALQKAPYIEDDEMAGFSSWLQEVATHISETTYETAKLHTPKGKGPGKAWACGKKNLFEVKEDGTPHWYCDFRMPFIYFSIFRDGKTVKTSRIKEELEKELKDGDQLLQCSHPGCFAWRDKLTNPS